MGVQSSSNQKIMQRHLKFLKVFKNNYKLNSQINDDIFGNAFLYENINSHSVEVMEKVLAIVQQSQMQKVTKTMEMRISHPHPNLIRVYSIQFLQSKTLCGGYRSVRVYTQYLKKTLKSQLNKRRKNGSYLSEQLLLKIIISLLNGITYLHDQNTFHGQIRTQTILADTSYHLKLVERALLSPSNWEIVAQKGGKNSGYKVLKGKGVLLSPCILQCLNCKSTQMANYDPFKADIFAIGMILLQCCSLKKAEDLYDYDNLTLNETQIKKIINECKRKYSYKLMNFVQKMLQFDDQLRPQARTLMNQMNVISGDTIREMNTTLNQSFLNQTILSFL